MPIIVKAEILIKNQSKKSEKAESVLKEIKDQKADLEDHIGLMLNDNSDEKMIQSFIEDVEIFICLLTTVQNREFLFR